jgi:hypothetical protein
LIGFCDNDIIHKLAAFDLLDVLPKLLGLTVADLRVLPTAKYQLLTTKPDKAARRYGSDVAQRIRQFLEVVTEVTDAPDPEDEAALAGLLGVDAGEALLLAACSREPESLLITGDKRCLAAITAAASCVGLSERLAGRVVCLEQVIQAAIAAQGFEAVRARIVPAVSCDLAIRAVFGSGMQAEEANVAQGLDSYIADLRGRTGGLLGSLQPP